MKNKKKFLVMCVIALLSVGVIGAVGLSIKIDPPFGFINLL